MANLNLLRIASDDTKIYGVYENTDPGTALIPGGIYYFEVDKTTDVPDDEFANAIKAAKVIVNRSHYGERNLLELTLDVSGNVISISFMPNDGQTPVSGTSRVFSGRIENKNFKECPNMPTQLDGIVQQIITKFSTSNRPIKIMRVNSGTNDQIYMEGH